jgi:hypothetical protein
MCTWPVVVITDRVWACHQQVHMFESLAAILGASKRLLHPTATVQFLLFLIPQVQIALTCLKSRPKQYTKSTYAVGEGFSPARLSGEGLQALIYHRRCASTFPLDF